MIDSFRSGTATLTCHFKVPARSDNDRRPAAILCHGFPIGPVDALISARPGAIMIESPSAFSEGLTVPAPRDVYVPFSKTSTRRNPPVP